MNLKHHTTAAPRSFIAVFPEVNARIGLCFSFVTLAEDNQPRSHGKQTGKGVGVCGEGRGSKELKSSQNTAATRSELIPSVGSVNTRAFPGGGLYFLQRYVKAGALGMLVFLEWFSPVLQLGFKLARCG